MILSGIWRLAATAIVGATGLLVGLYPASVYAQSATTSQRTIGPSGKVPLVTQDTRIEVTPEERRRREEALSRSNPPGPPVPVAQPTK
jgi:hypothetical protein